MMLLPARFLKTLGRTVIRYILVFGPIRTLPGLLHSGVQLPETGLINRAAFQKHQGRQRGIDLSFERAGNLAELLRCGPPRS